VSLRSILFKRDSRKGASANRSISSTCPKPSMGMRVSWGGDRVGRCVMVSPFQQACVALGSFEFGVSLRWVNAPMQCHEDILVVVFL